MVSLRSTASAAWSRRSMSSTNSARTTAEASPAARAKALPAVLAAPVQSPSRTGQGSVGAGERPLRG
eukprot:15443913-Alexandrium_andersonii.AAC.1